MKKNIRSFAFVIVTLSILTYSCSKDENVVPQTNEPTATGKTSLFEQVPEIENTQNTEDDLYLESVDFMTADSAPLSSSTTVKSSTSPYPGGTNPDITVEPGVLTAGEWNDLNNWDFWNNLLGDSDYFEEVNKWNLKSIKRYSFEVVDQNNASVANAEVSLLVNNVVVWKTKTDNDGKAALWSDLQFDKLSAIISSGGTTKTVAGVIEFDRGVNKVTFNKTIANKKLVDIYFAVDATGSMGDEINYLKAELSNVIESIKHKNPSLGMRFGSVFFRDKGDEYVTRDLPFTTDVSSLITFINEQAAQGGGDYPEAVHSALEVALTQNSWDDTASTRILFLLLDAPPHYTQESISSLEKSIQLAAEKGVKIIPIAASGIDKPTEYLMRSFAIITNGTYVFITDDSGVGNSHIKPTTGDFEVKKLNDLLIELVDGNVK